MLPIKQFDADAGQSFTLGRPTEPAACAPPQLPSLEIHIPISANTLFFNRVHYLVYSLRRFGGPYAGAKVVVTIGDPEIELGLYDRLPWLKKLGVEIRWVPVEQFAKYSYYATGQARFDYPFESDVVLMLDADTLITAPFTDMVTRVYQAQVLAGFIALECPFPEFECWQRLYDLCGLGPVVTRHEHTGWGYLSTDVRKRYCPPYFNFGVVCAPARLMTEIGAQLFDLAQQADRVHETMYRAQIALSLAVTKLGVPYWSLPARYNFPNCVHMEAMHPTEWPNASIIHLFRDNQGMNKDRVFDSIDHVADWIARPDLRCVNAKARDILREVHPYVVEDYKAVQAVAAQRLWNETTARFMLPAEDAVPA